MVGKAKRAIYEEDGPCITHFSLGFLLCFVSAKNSEVFSVSSGFYKGWFHCFMAVTYLIPLVVHYWLVISHS